MRPMLALLLILATVPPDAPKGADATRDAELAKLAAPIVDAPIDFDAHVAGKGPAYVFISTRDGLPQLYAGDLGKPEDPPRRLVTGTERTSGIRLSPDGKTVYFRMDYGSGENWRTYSLPVAGGTSKELTPGEEMQRDLPFVPEKAPKMLIYSARRRADKTFSVFVDNKVVYTDPSPGFLHDVSLDGKRAVFVRLSSISDNTLFTLDLASGKATRLYPPEGKEVRIHDAALSRDGSRVYVATDEGSEREVLLALELKTGKEVARLVSMPPTASVDGGR